VNLKENARRKEYKVPHLNILDYRGCPTIQKLKKKKGK